MTEALFSLHLALTLFMTGVIWFVQAVHYPLFARVGRDGFSDYEGEHARRTGRIVGPAMVLEGVTGALLLVARPEGLPLAVPAWGLVLLAAIFASTFLIQVPLHRTLGGGWLQEAHRQLLRSNWLRTGAWSARTVLLLGAALWMGF